MGERGPVGINFGENLSNSFKLADTFRKSGVLGEKNDINSKNEANEKVREILSSSFPVPYQNEGQYNNIKYESVGEMVSISQDESGKTEFVRDNAKNALSEIGLALSQNKEILKAATEGSDELNKLLPSNLHEIQPYILSVILTNGKDDTQGQEMVGELVDVFKLKKKANERPDFYEDDFKQASKKLFDKLYDRREELDSEAINNGTEGRIETAMGYVVGINQKKESGKQENFEVVNQERDEDESVDTRNNNENRNDRSADKNSSKKNYYEVLPMNDIVKLTEIAREQLNKIEIAEDLSNKYRTMVGQPTEVLDRITNKLESDLIDVAEKELFIAKRDNDTENIQKLTKNLEKYNLLRKEIQARLTIFDIGKLMSDASFRTGDRGMGDVIDQAAKINRIMDREVMGFCFEESKKVGLNIADAWDEIQEANFKYQNYLVKVWDSGLADDYEKKPVNGQIRADEERKANFLKLKKGFSLVPGQEMGLFLDKSIDPERAAIVDKYIISQLAENGKKSYQLANELANATGETSSFNFAFIKGHGLCEAIYFKAFRDDDASKGKKVGPISNRSVQSLTHGWVRYFSHLNDLSTNMELIKSEKIIENLDNIKGKEDSLMYFGKIVPSYVTSVKTALMDVDPDLKKVLNISHLQELAPSFDKVDVPYFMINTSIGWKDINESNGKFVHNGVVYKVNKETNYGEEENSNGRIKLEKSRCGESAMKVYYVLGLLELFATKENLGIDMVAMRRFRKNFVETNLSEIAKPFINEQQWNWVLSQKIANNGKGKDLDFMQAIRQNGRNKFVESFFDYFINGGTKKR